jgi:hypothetical protein
MEIEEGLMVLGLLLYMITWCAMLWFIWLFYGALQSINKIDDKLDKIGQNLEALDDIAGTIAEIHFSNVGPKTYQSQKKNRIVSHSEEHLAEKEKDSRK